MKLIKDLAIAGMMFFVAVVILVFMVYGYYLLLKKEVKYKEDKTNYNRELISDKPLFRLNDQYIKYDGKYHYMCSSKEGCKMYSADEENATIIPCKTGEKPHIKTYKLTLKSTGEESLFSDEYEIFIPMEDIR